MDMAIKAQTNGWVGFGVSLTGNMIGSEAVVGWVTSAGTQSIMAYTLQAQAVASILPDSNLTLTKTSVFNSNGTTITKFTRVIAGGNNPISTSGDTLIVAAFGSTRGLSQHASSSTAQASINFISGLSKTAPLDPQRITHGVMMTLAWAVMIPFGACLGRHRPLIKKCNSGKDKEDEFKWWPLHPALQASGYFLSLMAFVLAIVMVTGKQFHNWHHIMGLIITILGMIQVVWARFRPHHPDGYSAASTAPEHQKPTCFQAFTCNSPSDYSSARYIWENKHIWLGRILPLYGLCVVCSGFYKMLLPYPHHFGYFYAMVAYSAAVVVVEIILEIISCCWEPED